MKNWKDKHSWFDRFPG